VSRGERLAVPTADFNPSFVFQATGIFFGFGTNILAHAGAHGLRRFVLKIAGRAGRSAASPRHRPVLCLARCLRPGSPIAWQETGRTDVCALPSASSCRHNGIVVFDQAGPIRAPPMILCSVGSGLTYGVRAELRLMGAVSIAPTSADHAARGLWARCRHPSSPHLDAPGRQMVMTPVNRPGLLRRHHGRCSGGVLYFRRAGGPCGIIVGAVRPGDPTLFRLQLWRLPVEG